MKAIVACIALWFAAANAFAQPSEAERLYDVGQKAYDAKRYGDALAAWQESYELSRLPALLFNLAQAHRLRGQPGDCTKADDRYRQFIALEPKSSQVATATGFLKELHACVAAERTRAPAAPASAPSMPTLSANASEPRRPGRTKRIAAAVIAGGSVLVLATGIYFGDQARQIGKEVTAQCASGCVFQDVAAKDAEGRRAATKQWVSYGLGAAGLSAGGVLYWLGSRESTRGVAVSPRGGGAMVTWSRTW